MHTNSEGCLELLQYVPLQNYDSEITLIFMITVFSVIVMMALVADHFKQLLMNSKVFPYISLITTLLIMLNVFTLEVELAKVVKLLIKRLI